MKYPAIKTPGFFSRKYEDFTPKLLNQYYEYLMCELESRVWILRTHVISNPQFKNQELYSDESMTEVFNWALNNLKVKRLSDYSEKELLEFNLENASPYELSRKKHLALLLNIKNENHSAIHMLDIDDYKILMDLGLYFGECLSQRIEGAEWGLFRKKNYDITNRLVIFFSNGAAFCPFSEVELLLGDYFSEKCSFTDRLIELEEMK